MKVYTNDDVSTEALKGARIAIIGYGSQGRAHAQNLRDSGYDVVAGVREGGRGWKHAGEDKIATAEPKDAVHGADLVAMLAPDMTHEGIYADVVAPNLKKNATLMFAHGFSIHYGRVKPRADMDVILVAPKGPGIALRSRFLAGEGLPCLIAVHQEGSSGLGESFALSWAAGIGAARAAILKTTFAQETETDLFGEQAVLCGGMLALMRGAFETLVHAGFPPDLAYMECVQELKQVADLIYVHGPTGMAHRISNTAEFGAHAAIDVIDGPYLRQQFKAMLDQIRDGRFAQRLRDDADSGGRWLRARREALAAHAMEEAGRTVREWMPFLSGAPDRSSGR